MRDHEGSFSHSRHNGARTLPTGDAEAFGQAPIYAAASLSATLGSLNASVGKRRWLSVGCRVFHLVPQRRSRHPPIMATVAPTYRLMEALAGVFWGDFSAWRVGGVGLGRFLGAAGVRGVRGCRLAPGL